MVFTLISYLAGGVGLFLLGMALLTDGLKAFAGDGLRKALLIFTRKPVSAFLSGVVATSMVQSSSATTLMTIGFVSAGMLTFPAAIGVLIGASLGTTSTGWIVSLLGFKFSIGKLALIITFLGSGMRLLGRGRWSASGTALAGFGVLFIGLDFLQLGMGDLAQKIDLAAVPTEGLAGHLLVMLIGVAMTMLMQSSSAAVATTLTALHAGAINFDQSASLVIGAAIGTTVTAALAVIGAGVPAKRTALAHILFNLGTGLLAILLLPWLLVVISWAQDALGLPEGAVSLAAFHSMFIVIGVVIVLPFCRQFGWLVEKVLPDPRPQLTRFLDKSLLGLPAVALQAVHRCLLECTAEIQAVCADRIGGQISPDQASVAIEAALVAAGETQVYLAQIESSEGIDDMQCRRVDFAHAIDHLLRLGAACRADTYTAGSKMLRDEEGELIQLLDRLDQFCRASGEIADWDPVAASGAVSKQLADQRREDRKALLAQGARGESDPGELLEVLDSLQWLDRIAYHVWRIQYHLGSY